MSHVESPSYVDIIRVPVLLLYCLHLYFEIAEIFIFLVLPCAPPENSVQCLSFCGWLMDWEESGSTWSWTNQRVILSFVWRARGKMREMSANISIFLTIFKLGILRIQTSRLTAAVTCSVVQCYSKCSFSAVIAVVTRSVVQC